MGGGVSVVVGEHTLGIVMFVKDRILPGGDFVLVFGPKCWCCSSCGIFELKSICKLMVRAK